MRPCRTRCSRRRRSRSSADLRCVRTHQRTTPPTAATVAAVVAMTGAWCDNQGCIRCSSNIFVLVRATLEDSGSGGVEGRGCDQKW